MNYFILLLVYVCASLPATVGLVGWPPLFLAEDGRGILVPLVDEVVLVVSDLGVIGAPLMLVVLALGGPFPPPWLCLCVVGLLAVRDPCLCMP